ncbi:MAG: IS630 family transposase [Candidatus Thiodiazotropha sp. (ex Dulcina madagascariensis)]|nr:IS630 family transposase [Candidatus Thiodiazotropha sp. (ex Dulcina madagascariensis)]
MEIDGRKLSTEEQALIRRMAVQRVFEGESPTKVIRSYGMNDRTIYPWIRKAKAEGLDSLGPLPRAGRTRSLTEEQEREVARWVINGDPRQYGFDFGLWTRQIVADLIQNRLGIELSINSVGRLLHRQGITPQKPLRRAYERDEAAVKQWIEREYPIIKKEAKKCGTNIFWLDEASIRSDDPLQRTWGLKGKTPVVKTSGQRQSINAISALSNKGGFWYKVYTGRFNADKFIECLKDFMKYRKKPVYMIMDGHPVHKADKVKKYIEELNGRLSIFLLPPYAPDLNPDERVWNQMRHLGTSKKPLKKNESLKERAINDLQSIRDDKKLVKSFFQNTDVLFTAA